MKSTAVSGGVLPAGGDSALTGQQRTLVERNLGLVGLHIRRNVRNTAPGQSERDYEDLFQEGCMGLVRAARSYDPDGKIPFAAWALPRIHTAVSSALYGGESLVRRPRKRRRRRGGDGEKGDAKKVDGDTAPKVFVLEHEPLDPRRASPLAGTGNTIGERLRTRYDRAVTSASRAALRRKSQRSDREALIERVADERLLVPEPDARTPLRRIARDTGSSYSRVLQCERQLKRRVRRALAGDLEFEELRRLWRRAEAGGDSELDGTERRRLRSLAAEAFWRRLQVVSERIQTDVAVRVLRMADGSAVRTLFAELSEEDADELLLAVSAD